MKHGNITVVIFSHLFNSGSRCQIAQILLTEMCVIILWAKKSIPVAPASVCFHTNKLKLFNGM